MISEIIIKILAEKIENYVKNKDAKLSKRDASRPKINRYIIIMNEIETNKIASF